MRKRKSMYVLLIVVLSLLCNAGCQTQSNPHHQSKSTNKHQIVTLFMHGYGGTENSEKFMVNQAVKKGVTHDVVKAIVDSNNQVHLQGHISKNELNPIVEIIFKDNKNGNMLQNANRIKNVLMKVKDTYHINEYNFVAHSMGNLSFAYFMKNDGHNPSLPTLKKEVNIAGTYNGVLNLNEKVNEIQVDQNGKPNKMNEDYKNLLGLKDIYKGKQIEVLNIYGDLQDGTHSDGKVSNSSSRSLKYLLGTSPKTYKESKYTGLSAQHSQLHENIQVANEIIKILWNK